MPIDRNSFWYRFDKALARGWRLPEPKTDEERRYRDRSLRHQAIERERKDAARTAAMARPAVALNVKWSEADLIFARGTCRFGAVRLARTGAGAALSFAPRPGDVDALIERPWTLAGARMPEPLREGCHPGSEWGRAEHTIRIVQSQVPAIVSDDIFDRLGIPPAAWIARWNRRAPSVWTEKYAAWQRAWGGRHHTLHPAERERQRLDFNQAPASDIAASVRGIGPRRARAIVDERDLRGPYESHPDIATRVRGVGGRTVSAIIVAGYRV